MSPRLLRILALFTILAGALVRAYGLGVDSFDTQEVAQIRAAELPTAGMLRSSTPVPALITSLALHWGYDESTIRWPSAVAGATTVWVVWRLAATLLGAEAALYAAAMMAFSPFHVAISRTASPAAWLTLLAALTVLLFAHAAQARHGIARWLGFAAVAAMGCLSGYAALLVLAAVLTSAVVLAVREHAMITVAVRTAIASGALAALVLAWMLYSPPDIPRSVTYLRPDWPFFAGIAAALATGGAGARLWAVGLLGLAVLGAVSRGVKVHGGLAVWWAVVGIGGLIVTDWWLAVGFRQAQVGFAFPAYCLLIGAGLRTIREAVDRPGARWTRGVAQAAALGVVLVSQLPALRSQAQSPRSQWREIAAIVRANVQPNDKVVAILSRDTFVFYAPDLERRVRPAVPPGRAAGYFVSAERGWLVVPVVVRAYPGWKKLRTWLKRFPPVELSPDASVFVFYMGRGGRGDLLREAAFFDLPAASLVRGKLLFELLQLVGPLPPVLWKVDQIALSRQPLKLRNPELLNAVYYLAEHGHGDRAASLAYRLATAEPDWEEAQSALAAFRPAAPAGSGF